MFMIPDEKFFFPERGSFCDNHSIPKPAKKCGVSSNGPFIFTQSDIPSTSSGTSKLAPTSTNMPTISPQEPNLYIAENTNQSSFGKDSGIDEDCFEEEDHAKIGLEPQHNMPQTIKFLESSEICGDFGERDIYHTLLCFLPDLSGFKGLVLTQSPTLSGNLEVKSKNFECYLRRLLNPLWRPQANKDGDNTHHPNDPLTKCYTNHVIIGKRICEKSLLVPRIIQDDAQRKARLSLPTLLPSMFSMGQSMHTIYEQSISHCQDNSKNDGGTGSGEYINMDITRNAEQTDETENSVVTDKSDTPKKELTFTVEVIEHDTNHNFEAGMVTLSLTPQTEQTTLSMPANIPKYRKNSLYECGQHAYIKELLISNPHLFHESISAPELSCMYRAKRQSHGDILSSTLKDLALAGPNLQFKTQHVYKSDRANMLIARSLSKDLVDKGCFVCAGPIAIKFPKQELSTSPLQTTTPRPVGFGENFDKVLDESEAGIKKLVVRKKRFPNFLSNYKPTIYSPTHEDDPTAMTPNSPIFDNHHRTDGDVIHTYF